MRRRSNPLVFDALETRNLLTLAGVSLTYGNLLIEPTKPSGNVVQLLALPDNVLVLTVNGQEESLPLYAGGPYNGGVLNVTYVGGQGGGDTFVNDTSLVSLDYGFGGGNAFTGGAGFNYVFFYGNGNTFAGQPGEASDVFEDGGTDTIEANGAVVQVYS